ncbi:MAG TPA: glutamyl-tRNA reductase [Streptosporangiaceae bacterium]|nr:glutamyl-tRNA reductase [Streptosporangiaceae bacterium]
MSLLIVGLSHASAPVATLERAVVSGDAQTKLLHDVYMSPNVTGAMVLSTCNRVEIYAEVDSFHGGVAAICDLLARHSGLPIEQLTGSVYVHYQDRAAQHLLAVACGLESVVVGESQILGQVRQAVRIARQHDTLGRELSDLSRMALRAGKRAHTETDIDAAGQNLVTLGLGLAAAAVRGESADDDRSMLSGLRVVVVGAGAMSSLAVATAARSGAASVLVVNRTRSHAERLAEKYGARAIGLAELEAGIAAADLVVTCTGATGHVITTGLVTAALTRRDRPRPGGPAGQGETVRPLVLLDLAIPRDVEPDVASLDGVGVIDMSVMADAGTSDVAETSAVPGTALPGETEVTAVRRIVAQELSSFLYADRAASVAPTVVALRAKAATVVEAELARLERRLGNLEEKARQEIAQSMGRIADKLLHGPTVRVKELAGSPGADSYEAALRVLFELDPDTVQSIGRPDEDMLAWPAEEGGE